VPSQPALFHPEFPLLVILYPLQMNDNMAWITGANGLIGHALIQAAGPNLPWTVRPLTRTDVDLTDRKTVARLFHQELPALIIHCAALSKSTACQANPALAQLLNVDVTAQLVELAADIPLVFFSTDLVFDGLAGNYDESAPINPLSVYAETKVAAERIVLANPKHSVIRTSLNGGASPTGDRGFNEEMRLAWTQSRTLNLFVDEFRCPIAATETARAVWEMVGRNCRGLYHLAGSERLSRWQIGQLLAARWPQLNPKIKPGSLKDYSGAPRSPDISLNCSKAQALLSFPLPGFTKWLEDHPNVPF
jgi:dTDP-4-dehydrorhamnose reductase